MWSIGLLLFFFGYALLYTGMMNMSKADGPTLAQSLGIPGAGTNP